MKRFHFEATSVISKKGKIQEAIQGFRHGFIRAQSSVHGAKKVGPVEIRYVAPSTAKEITVSWWGTFDLPTEKEAAELEFRLSCLGKTRAAMHFMLCDVPGSILGGNVCDYKRTEEGFHQGQNPQ